MATRKTLLAVVVAGALALWGAASASADVVYVTTLSSGVQAYKVTATGALKRLSASPFPAGQDGFGVTATPDGRFLYASNYADRTLSGFSLAPGTGALSPLAGSPFPTRQAVLSAVTPDGSKLYVVGDGDPGVVAGYHIDPATGALKRIKTTPVRAGNVPYGVAVSHDGAFLYVSVGGTFPATGGIAAYRIAPGTGRLAEIAGSPFAAGPETAGLAVTPDDTHVYAANSLTETISGYTRDPTTGALTPVAHSPFPAGPNEPTGLVVTPDGKHLYTANASQADPTQSNVVGFAINTATGALNQVPGSPVPAGSGATLAALTPDGSKLYVTDNAAGTLSGYTVDAATGALTELAGSPFPTRPHPLGITVAAPPQ
jgi:6-phosphogluconolactonase